MTILICANDYNYAAKVQRILQICFESAVFYTLFIIIYNFSYSFGSHDTTPTQIISVFNNLAMPESQNHFTINIVDSSIDDRILGYAVCQHNLPGKSRKSRCRCRQQEQEPSFQTVKHSNISHTTIKTYLDILQDVFLIERAVRYDIKGRKYIDTPAKYYFSDLGLRNARINFRQPEETHMMENLIYNELRLRGMSVDVGVVVKNEKDANGVSVRKQLEVDFVCNLGSQRYYIQSALRLPTVEKRKQEVRSLKSINDSFRKFVITEDLISRYQDNDGIVYMNIYEFLLDENSLRV